MGDRSESDELAVFGAALMFALIAMSGLLLSAQSDRRELLRELRQCEATHD